MKQISEQTAALLKQLAALNRPATGWFGKRAKTADIVNVLKALADCSESAIIPALVHFAFDGSAAVAQAAARAIHRLLLAIEPVNWPPFGEEFHQRSEWDLCRRWYYLKPQQLVDLITVEETRPTLLGLATLHHNGYVRQEAVVQLAKERSGFDLPFLLIRANDWVPQVRTSAAAAIADRLVDDYAQHFVRQLPLVIRLLQCGRANHTEMVRAIAGLLVKPQHAALLAEAVASPDRVVRQECLKFVLERHGDHLPEIVRKGIQSSDPVVRFWSSRRVGAALPADSVKPILERLRHDRFMPVRREALLLLAEKFPESAESLWTDALLDRHISIRELSRIRLPKLSKPQFAEIYRIQLNESSTRVVAVDGLGETGSTEDLNTVRTFLKSPLSGVRRAAVRALDNIGGDAVIAELVECLRDNSPSVSRQAQKSLLKRTHLIDGDRLFEIVASHETLHVRLNALAVIYELGKWRCLSYLIRAAALDEPTVASVAKDYLERSLVHPRFNRHFVVLTDAERQAITAAMTTCCAALSKETYRLLEMSLR